jgi:uncharacterized protein
MSIAWRDWSPLAFTQSRETRRPLLLSLVTAWSDECAAMDRTTFSHPDVVSLVEQRFVPVRVDADRRPDINDRYNLGGWPTTVFLTDAGDVLSGGTYLDAVRLAAVLLQVADAYRDRADELAVRASRVRTVGLQATSSGLPADRSPRDTDLQASRDHAIGHFRSLLIDRFDAVHGGFGTVAKLPHPYALLLALSLAGSGDPELRHIAELTLDRMQALWDSSSGGFFRYADSADWSWPGTEKTLEDNAALLQVYVEAALQLRDERCREQAGAIVRWTKGAMTDEEHGGFFNAISHRGIDKTMYVDRNAMMVGSLLRAAALFDDVWLRDLALKAFESVIVPAYKPGEGVAHVSADGDRAAVRGLLTDQIHVALALIWGHAATGQLPYSMLAAEVLQFAVRTMWDEPSGRFRDRVDAEDPVFPFELNCHAACAFDRLAVLTGDRAHQDRAQTILHALANEYAERDLFGMPYGLAIREVLDRHPPAGLELGAVDWKLEG